MPRIRSIKPSFFKSEDVSALPLRARLTWIGLWTHCDDAGRTKDNVRLIKGDIWPLDDVSLKDIEEDLVTLATHGRIVRYEVGGQRYLEIANWSDHQRINRPTESRIPPPEEHVSRNGALSEPSPQEGRGKEGKGRERVSAQEPPRQCPEHLANPSPPPCGACGDARRAYQRWEAERTARTRDAPQCRSHRGQLAANCAPCRSEQLAKT